MTWYSIGSLNLPETLCLALDSGEWPALAHSPALQQVFRGESGRHASFYTVAAIRQENEGWATEKRRAYLGFRGPGACPGDIDPARSVLVADLGPDVLVALDYRASPPAVIFLPSRSEQWFMAARSVEALIAALVRPR